MKQFFILLIATLLAAPAGFSQDGRKPRLITPLVADEYIRHIIISGNVDVLLIEDVPANIGVKVPSSCIEKMKLRVDGENLFISAREGLATNDRVQAYVTVSDLHSLELKGNAVVTSKGILNSRRLTVVSGEKGVVALRSGGPVNVTSAASYEVIKQHKYYSVFAGNL